MATQPWYRHLARGLLGLFAAWHLLAFTDNVRLLQGEPRRFADVTWPVTWQMFTKKGGVQDGVRVEGRFGAVWTPLPMREWLPAEWEADYRWERAAGSSRVLRPFLLHACARSGAREVRLVRHRWKLVHRSATQPERDPKVEIKGAVRCP